MSKKYLIIDTRPYGLFSIFLHTIDCIKWAELNNFIPFIRWGNGRADPNHFRLGANEASLKGNPSYVKNKENFITPDNILNNSRPCLYLDNANDNPWEYFFESINDEKIEEVFKNDYKINDIFMCGELDFDLDNKFLIKNLHSYDALKLWSLVGTDKESKHRNEVNKIINKYIKIKDSILKQVDSFINVKFKHNDNIIGVHVRGTDKKTEFPFKQLEIEQYIQKIKEQFIENKNNKIYVASDNNEAIIKIANYFGKDKIIAFPSMRMKDFHGSKPIFFVEDVNKKIHGIETMIEMLILSKCNTIIGTDSNLTATASFFNVEAKLIYLDRKNGV
jgi:hypothetical protein